jgi:hypothetical protein
MAEENGQIRFPSMSIVRDYRCNSAKLRKLKLSIKTKWMKQSSAYWIRVKSSVKALKIRPKYAVARNPVAQIA